MFKIMSARPSLTSLLGFGWLMSGPASKTGFNEMMLPQGGLYILSIEQEGSIQLPPTRAAGRVVLANPNNQP